MTDFWENVFRFPRFFISSVIGLLLTILGPFLNLLNRPRTTIIFVIISILSLSFLTLTLKLMLGIET